MKEIKIWMDEYGGIELEIELDGGHWINLELTPADYAKLKQAMDKPHVKKWGN